MSGGWGRREGEGSEVGGGREEGERVRVGGVSLTEEAAAGLCRCDRCSNLRREIEHATYSVPITYMLLCTP